MNMRIITKNIRKVKDNEAKVSFLDNFNCIPRGSLTMILLLLILVKAHL